MGSPLISRFANGTVWLDQSHFVPIPQLYVSDADLLVAFLSPEGILFLNQTYDPWYRATVPGASFRYVQGDARRLYIPDEAASPMGCVQRYQYCNSSKKCGSLASLVDALTSVSTLFHLPSGYIWSTADFSHQLDATAKRFAMFQSILVLQGATGLLELLSVLGPSSLLASQHLSQSLMGPLPDNQWQLDVSHWFAIILASMQASSVNTARGPTDEALLPYFVTIEDEYQREMCNNQVSKVLCPSPHKAAAKVHRSILTSQ